MATLGEIETTVQNLIKAQDLEAIGLWTGSNIRITSKGSYSKGQLDWLINQYSEIYSYAVQSIRGWLDLIYPYTSGSNTIGDIVDYVQNLIDNNDKIEAMVWTPDDENVKIRFIGQYNKTGLEHLINHYPDEITTFTLYEGDGPIVIYYLYDETLSGS